MSTAVYDSSLLTLKRQQQALYVFKRDLAAAAATNPYQVRSIAGGLNGNPSQEAVSDSNQGCSVCNAVANGFLNSMGTKKNSCNCSGANTF